MAAIATSFALKYGKEIFRRVKDGFFKPTASGQETGAKVIPMADFMPKLRGPAGGRLKALSSEDPVRQVLDRDFEAEGFKLAGREGTADDMALHVQLIRAAVLSALEVVVDEARQSMAMIDRELITQGKSTPVQSEMLRFDYSCFEQKVSRVEAEKVLVANGEGLAEIPELMLSLGYNAGVRERTAHCRPSWSED